MKATLLVVLAVLAGPGGDGTTEYLDDGNALIAQEDYVGAESLFRTALEADPDNPVYRTQLALCLIYQERHAEADTELSRVLINHPNDVAALWYGAINRYEEGAYREAAGRRIYPRFGAASEYARYVNSVYPQTRRAESAYPTSAGAPGHTDFGMRLSPFGNRRSS